MDNLRDNSKNSKWLCNKCHIWSVNQVARCSWCGSPRPQPKPQPKPEPPKED